MTYTDEDINRYRYNSEYKTVQWNYGITLSDSLISDRELNILRQRIKFLEEENKSLIKQLQQGVL